MARPSIPTLTVRPSAALAQLRGIAHARCQAAIRNHWHATGKTVSPQSVCWLFCWAKTGLGSQRAAEEARRVFDCILSIGFDAFDARVPHSWARAARYATGDLTDELATRLRT